MNVIDLRAFLAVAETASFSGAAERLFVTQPAVSKRIAALEGELGMRLFDRIGRHVSLSPAGQALLPRAHRIINEVEDAKRSLGNLTGEVAGTLRIATSHHVGLHRLPPALKRFSQQYPQARLDLRFLDSEQGCSLVAQGQVELAVVTLPPKAHPQLTTFPVWHDVLDVVVASAHPLAKRGRWAPTDLLAHPAILPGAGTYTRDLILQAFGTHRDALSVGLSTNYLEVIKMLAAIGLGWTVLPRTLIDADLKVIQIEGVRIERTLGIVSHRERTLSTAAQRMIETIKATE